MKTVLAVLIVILFAFVMSFGIKSPMKSYQNPNPGIETSTPVSENPKSKMQTLEESDLPQNSSSADWWLSSGGIVYLDGNLGKTIQGELPANSSWRLLYAENNPVDTDNGYHPQNIFRLVEKNQLQDSSQEVYFKIAKYNLSDSPNRNSSNGLLFFNRYQDAFNLYYTGIRVDGYVTIKKKIDGTYYTLAYKPFTKNSVYSRDTNPNLLPLNTWIGIRSEVRTDTDGTVSIKFYTDIGKTGNWILAAEATDDGKTFGGEAILNTGHGGIRTDFMDVEFSDYKFTSL